MPDWPMVPLFCFLFLVAYARAGATYAIGRGVRGLADHRTAMLERAGVRQAERVVERYGAPAVALCFLTVGVQTAVNAAAGGLRMPLSRYLPALFVGALIWATIYLTIGFAVLEALWGGQWWLPPVVIVVLAAAGWLVRWWLHRPQRCE